MFWSFFPNRYRREKESIQQKFNEQEIKAIKLEKEVKGYIYIFIHKHTHMSSFTNMPTLDCDLLTGWLYLMCIYDFLFEKV